MIQHTQLNKERSCIRVNDKIVCERGREHFAVLEILLRKRYSHREEPKCSTEHCLGNGALDGLSCLWNAFLVRRKRVDQWRHLLQLVVPPVRFYCRIVFWITYCNVVSIKYCMPLQATSLSGTDTEDLLNRVHWKPDTLVPVICTLYDFFFFAFPVC
jgi:hypothetical protein